MTFSPSVRIADLEIAQFKGRGGGHIGQLNIPLNSYSTPSAGGPFEGGIVETNPRVIGSRELSVFVSFSLLQELVDAANGNVCLEDKEYQGRY
jgi:hypothetical protein